MHYELDPEKPALVYEVMLPKRMDYSSKLAEVLGCFFKRDQLRQLPPLKAELDAMPDPDEREQFITRVQEAISGYSIYEVDGRYGTPKGPKDERTLVIRFIIHDPRVKGGMTDSLKALAKNIVVHLISKRFAEELGTEHEIWFLEFGSPTLQRWVKKAD
jgi:hypothetical protein